MNNDNNIATPDVAQEQEFNEFFNDVTESDSRYTSLPLRKKVNIKAQSFGIWRMMQDIPYKKMWIRELIRNAIEATVNYLQSGKTKKSKANIDIKALEAPVWASINWAKTAPKLTFLNLGGMTAEELVTCVEVFSSGSEKTQSDEDNFGFGLVNPAAFSDVLITSRKGDKAHTVIIGLEGKDLVYKNDTTPGHPDFDVTEQVEEATEARGYPKGEDFTEVVLLGEPLKDNGWFAHPSQNTVMDPYNEKKKSSKTPFA